MTEGEYIEKLEEENKKYIKSISSFENTIRKLVAALEDQNERFKADLEEIHEAIWDVDIPSPTCPEYREHHQQMQELMKLVKKKIEERRGNK